MRLRIFCWGSPTCPMKVFPLVKLLMRTKRWSLGVSQHSLSSHPRTMWIWVRRLVWTLARLLKLVVRALWCSKAMRPNYIVRLHSLCWMCIPLSMDIKRSMYRIWSMRIRCTVPDNSQSLRRISLKSPERWEESIPMMALSASRTFISFLRPKYRLRTSCAMRSLAPISYLSNM